jgi:hypothetical protein
MTARTGGLKNFETCDQAFECVRPMKPSPIIATLISRIGRFLDLWNVANPRGLRRPHCHAHF